MKKYGFTLAEIVVSLGIVGILAAMTMPAIENAIPDSDKVKVIKAQKVIYDINQELLTDPGTYDSNGGSCLGLTCTGTPLAPPYNTATYSGAVKYPRLLAAHLKSTDVVNGANSSTFNTLDGIYWTVNALNGSNHSITIDLDGNGVGKGCSYNSSSCKKPDQFKFIVTPNGRLIGDDNLTKAYLANPLTFNEKRKDFAAASAGKF